MICGSNRRRLVAVVLCGLLFGGAVAQERPKPTQTRRLPRALLVEGLWTDHFRLREACHRAGIAYEGAYKSRSAYWRPNDRLFGMPDDVSRFDVLVLCNVDAATLGDERLDEIRRFVEDGGGLVVLGGYWAFSRGAYVGTPLEVLLPVDMPPENRIVPVRQGLPLSARKGAPWSATPDFAAGPLAFFVQTLRPRAGSEVWLTAGDKPAVIAWNHGKGRVVAVALTVHGEAPEGGLAFWDWADWPALLGALVDWAAAGPGPVRTVAESTAITSEELFELEMELTMGNAPEALIRRAMATPTRETAEVVFRYAIGGDEATGRLGNVGRRLIPFAKPEWSALLANQAGFTNPDLADRYAALALLGATRTPEALPILLNALRYNEVRSAAIEGIGLTGIAAEIPRLQRLFDDLMRTARDGRPDGSILPDPFGHEMAEPMAETAIALYRLGDENAVERLVDLYRRVHLYHRIFRNAGKRRVLEKDVQGIEIRKRIWDATEKLLAVRERLRQAAGPVPPAQAESFVRLAAAETDPVGVAWLLYALEHRQTELPVAAWIALADAADGIIARTARMALE